jgi:hypothetical protein
LDIALGINQRIAATLDLGAFEIKIAAAAQDCIAATADAASGTRVAGVVGLTVADADFQHAPGFGLAACTRLAAGAHANCHRGIRTA